MGNEQDDRERQEIRRRSDEETAREHRATKQVDEPPGGAEGGDESPSADRPMGLPARDKAPLGSTDQHSSDERVPPRRGGDSREGKQD